MKRQVAESLANTTAGMFSTMLVRNASLCPGAELRWAVIIALALPTPIGVSLNAALPDRHVASPAPLPPNPGGRCTRSGYGLFALTRSSRAFSRCSVMSP